MPSCSAVLTFIALAGSVVPPAIAFSATDPFNSEAIAPPRPLLFPAAERADLPCQAVAPGTVYGVLEVVDLALCQNPRTHEAWASARVQAALVGLAQSEYLPALDGSVGIERSRSNGQNATARSASLTLSWLLLLAGAMAADEGFSATSFSRMRARRDGSAWRRARSASSSILSVSCVS